MIDKNKKYRDIQDSVAKIFIQYHKYILTQIDFESQYKDIMEKGKPYERQATALDDDTYVQLIYRNNPMFHRTVDEIASYIMSELEVQDVSNSI